MSDGTPRQHFADGHAALPLLATAPDTGAAGNSNGGSGTSDASATVAGGGPVDAAIQSSEDGGSLETVRTAAPVLPHAGITAQTEWPHHVAARMACARFALVEMQAHAPPYPFAGPCLAECHRMGRDGARWHRHGAQLQRLAAAPVVPLAPCSAGRACSSTGLVLEGFHATVAAHHLQVLQTALHTAPGVFCSLGLSGTAPIPILIWPCRL